MQQIAVLTVMSSDKPGVIEAVAKCVSDNRGNWLESKLAQMGGKFVGVVRISIDTPDRSTLQKSLDSLKNQGIHVDIDTATDATASNDSLDEELQRASFHALGPDRTGIIRELSSAFSSRTINVESLETKLSSMPYSGEPIFEASGYIDIPKNAELDDLHQKLDDISDDLGIDISIKMCV